MGIQAIKTFSVTGKRGADGDVALDIQTGWVNCEEQDRVAVESVNNPNRKRSLYAKRTY